MPSNHKKYQLQDCSPIEIKEFKKLYADDFKNENQVVGWLKRLSEYLSESSIITSNIFKTSDKYYDPEPVIYTDINGKWWTGRYIGSITFDNVTIEIHPRFGIEFVIQNLKLNNFIITQKAEKLLSGNNFIFILQAFIWCDLVTKAARHSLPTVKKPQEHYSTRRRVKSIFIKRLKSRFIILI